MEEISFATDSALEEDGFELSVSGERACGFEAVANRLCRSPGCRHHHLHYWGRCRCSVAGAVRKACSFAFGAYNKQRKEIASSNCHEHLMRYSPFLKRHSVATKRVHLSRGQTLACLTENDASIIS